MYLVLLRSSDWILTQNSDIYIYMYIDMIVQPARHSLNFLKIWYPKKLRMAGHIKNLVDTLNTKYNTLNDKQAEYLTTEDARLV